MLKKTLIFILFFVIIFFPFFIGDLLLQRKLASSNTIEIQRLVYLLSIGSLSYIMFRKILFFPYFRNLLLFFIGSSLAQIILGSLLHQFQIFNDYNLSFRIAFGFIFANFVSFVIDRKNVKKSNNKGFSD